METWIVACLVFVFLALVEYGIVLYLISKSSQKTSEIEGEAKSKRRHQALVKVIKDWQNKRGNVNPDINGSPTRNPSRTYTLGSYDNQGDLIENLEEKAKVQSHKADRIALMVLPLLFLLFNIVYWIEYTA